MPKHIDPKLHSVMQEIADICKKHDVGAFVSLASQSHSEFALMPPTWSIAQWEAPADALNAASLPEARLRIVNTHLGDREKKRFSLEVTLHYLLCVRDQCGVMARQLQMVAEIIKSNGIDFEHRNQVAGGN